MVHGPAEMNRHVEGMWIAFGLAAVFIVYFVQRVTRALAAREAELEAARLATARHEKLASLATLAAGAAHQLSTPLSTIAVVAKELEHQLAHSDAGEEPVADARLIREQVERCRDILTQMAADAGESAGESTTTVRIAEILESARRGLADAERVAVDLTAAERTVLRVPPRALAQALRALIRNALDATPVSAAVRITARTGDSRCSIEVRDSGGGMSREVLARAGEPFYTTKAPGKGMGLGLFLARAVVERLGGSLELDSSEGRGTCARVVLPMPAEHPSEAAADESAPHLASLDAALRAPALRSAGTRRS